MNLLDYQAIRLNYALLFDLPMITRYDISSQSIAVIETVKTWKPDDKVYDSPSDLEDWEVMQHITLQINPHYLTYKEAAAVPFIGGKLWEILVVRPPVIQYFTLKYKGFK